MSIWNFSYDLMFAPTKFNIRPTVTITSITEGLTINAGSTIIRNFTLSQILTLTTGMRIEIVGDTVFSTTRTIISINIIERSVVYSGTAINYSVTPENTFIFYSQPGAFSHQNSPLSGQQIHDNFFYLSEGILNHQDRLSLVETYSQSAPSELDGYVKYTGITRTIGSFYGGKDLELIATSDFNLATVYSPTQLSSFSISMENGISYPTILNSVFYIINVGEGLASNNTFTPTTFCNYVNGRLINDGSAYGFGINSYTSMSPYTMLEPYFTERDWNVASSYAAFYIKIDDADTQDIIKVSFTNADRTNILSGGISTLVSVLNGKIGAISTKIEAKQMDVGGGVRLVIEGKNIRNSLNPGCTRIQILNVDGGDFINSVLRMNVLSAYDFSTTIQFVPYGNKVKIIGLDPSFKIVLKDSEDEPTRLLYKAGYGILEFQGDYTVTHTAIPNNDSTTVNFNGKFNAYSFNSETASFTTLNVTSLTLTNLTVTGTNTYPNPINVSFEDLYINNDLKVNDNTLLNTMTVTGATTFSSTVAMSGANTISGATTFSNYTYITNLLHDVNHTLYKSQLLNSGVVVPANAPEDTLDSQYLLYNGSFGAFNLDAVGTLAVHGNTKASGRFYTGSTVPTSTAITLNYDGNFKATALTGTSTRESKTDIFESKLNALDVLMNTLVVDYKFKTDLDTQRIGFIAEDTHMLLSTPSKDGVDVTNSIGVIIKAIQELYTLIKK